MCLSVSCASRNKLTCKEVQRVRVSQDAADLLEVKLTAKKPRKRSTSSATWRIAVDPLTGKPTAVCVLQDPRMRRPGAVTIV